MLAAQLIYTMRTGMVIHLEDFYLRRLPLFAARADHGLGWAEKLSQVWARERGMGQAEAAAEFARLRTEIERRHAWARSLQA